MKKLLVLLAASFAIACGGGSSDAKSDSTSSSTTTETTPASTDGVPAGISKEDYDKGLSLIAGSDCLTCHEISAKKTGPAYQDVAAKYENTEANIEMLAGKIIKGGTGVWGQVPMTPHDTMPVDDAKTMVKYILSLKNAK
ncbi:MAG TPA: c-type cytochrome [Chitinophagaceae bacterium]|nr:c-type cytochrome [Chitinophagaceae bacterium]